MHWVFEAAAMQTPAMVLAHRLAAVEPNTINNQQSTINYQHCNNDILPSKPM
jgi:hypothetical protein